MHTCAHTCISVFVCVQYAQAGHVFGAQTAKQTEKSGCLPANVIYPMQLPGGTLFLNPRTPPEPSMPKQPKESGRGPPTWTARAAWPARRVKTG